MHGQTRVYRSLMSFSQVCVSLIASANILSDLKIFYFRNLLRSRSFYLCLRQSCATKGFFSSRADNRIEFSF